MEPWKTNIEFTVTPTDDPDVVDVRQEGNVWPVQRNRVDGGGDNPGPATIAARAYFDAHQPEPVHPLADAKAGRLGIFQFDTMFNDGIGRKIINTVNLKPGHEYPAYVMPEVPKVGDYVRLTMKDGKTREGEVRETHLLRNVGYEPTEVRLEGDYSAYGYCYGKDPGNFNPKWQIVRVEKIVRIPEIGKWIEATTHDGKTHTFEITAHKKNQWWTFLRSDFPNYDDLFVSTRDIGDDKKRSIKSWKYVDAPAKIVEIDGYFIVRYQDEVKVYDNKTTAEAHKYWGGLVHVTSVLEGYEKIARYAQRDATYQRYIPALLAAIKFIEGGN